MKKFTLSLVLTACTLTLSAQNANNVSFRGVFRLLNQLTDGWQLPTQSFAEDAGLELVLYHCWDEGEFNSLCFGYARNANINTERDGDYNHKIEKTADHACVMVVEAATGSGGYISFSDKADYDRFLKEAIAHGVLQEQGGDANTYFINGSPLKGGKVIKVSNQELFAAMTDFKKAKYHPRYMLVPKGKNAKGWYTYNIGIDF